MNISSVNGTEAIAVSNINTSQNDAVTKSLQLQISQKQQEMQKLSSNQELDEKEKSEKRKQLQQEIAALNMQLRQHQIELRKEQLEQKTASSQKTRSGNAFDTPEVEYSVGMTSEEMNSVISAGVSLRNAATLQKSATGLNSASRIAEADIKSDRSRGMDTSRKEEQLAELKARASETEASHIRTLAEAVDYMRNASSEGNRTPNSTEATDRDRNPDGTEAADK